MRDRLIEALDIFYYTIESITRDDIEEIADHILADGWMKLPCKVGDIVWNREAAPYKVISIEWFSRKVTHLHCVSPVTNIRHTFAVGKRSLGKTVFLTREAAENALRMVIKETDHQTEKGGEE